MSLLKRLEKGQGDQPEPEPEKGGEAKPPAGGEPQAGGSRLSSLQARRGGEGEDGKKNTYSDLKTRVQNRLLAEMDPGMDVTQVAEVRKTIQSLFEQILSEESIVLSRQERAKLR